MNFLFAAGANPYTIPFLSLGVCIASRQAPHLPLSITMILAAFRMVDSLQPRPTRNPTLSARRRRVDIRARRGTVGG